MSECEDDPPATETKWKLIGTITCGQREFMHLVIGLAAFQEVMAHESESHQTVAGYDRPVAFNRIKPGAEITRSALQVDPRLLLFFATSVFAFSPNRFSTGS